MSINTVMLCSLVKKNEDANDKKIIMIRKYF